MHHMPYTIENPATREQVTIKNDNDIKEMFLSFLDYTDDWATIFSFAQITICYYRLRDDWANEMIGRYDYCKQWNTPPYDGSYDAHPAVWRDISSLIVEQVNTLMRCKCHEHNPKTDK